LVDLTIEIACNSIYFMYGLGIKLHTRLGVAVPSTPGVTVLSTLGVAQGFRKRDNIVMPFSPALGLGQTKLMALWIVIVLSCHDDVLKSEISAYVGQLKSIE
jgi:hypothetical protein